MVRKILGSGGGGGGGSTFVTKPDTLRSDDNFEILLGLGSGRWKGLVNGLQSLELNGVSLENADGTSNFEDVFMIFADGNPLEDQIVSFQLGGGGNTQTINTQLVNTTGTGTWVSGSVSTPNANYIDIRFLVNQLFYQDEKSIRENTANIEIEMRPSGSPDWTNIFSGSNTSGTVYDPDGYDYLDDRGFSVVTYLSRSMFNSNGIGFRGTSTNTLDITGKTTSPYIKELRVAVPNTGDYANKTWEVRVRLNNLDSVDTDDIQERRTIVLETLAAVITDDLGDDPEWDGLVWAQIHGKASDQFNGFPEITGVFDTKICQVPPSTVFDPDTRTYTNVTWDGSFEEAFTTDPAWQIKEFVEDPIHGVAGIYPGATLDKWDALEASKYFSEQVPDGRGGTHPRFSMNLTITEAKEIDEMMQYLAGAVNSYTEDIGGGTWRFKVDKPEDPVMLFTEDNVFTEFQYSHSDIDTRFNDWRGTFLDESLDYETNTVRVFDQGDIDLNGIKFTEVALIGCTHPQEALRRLMFRLRVSLNEFRSVSFETNRIGRLINPLDTILVADGSLNPDHLVKSTSRLDSHSGTTVTLKRPLRLETGVAYTIKFSTTNGVVERTVQNDSNSRGDVTSIEIDSALPAEVMADSAVALEATGLAALPVTYRVLSVDRDEDDEDRYTISAVQIDSGKWGAMDNVSQTDIYAQESSIDIDSPTIPSGGMFNVVEYVTDVQHKRVLQVNWDRPAGNFLDGYRVQHRLNNGPWHLVNSKLTDSILELQNPEDGTYDFKIEALDRRGVQSNPLVGRYTLDSDANVTPPAHDRGDLLSRPLEGPYDGFRFTATDQTPIITQVWDATGENWVDENNLVTQGTDIGVENGATVGMTTAEAAQLSQAEQDIADLETTYGSTASAAQSAADAEAAQTAAEAAQAAAAANETAAETHRDAAQLAQAAAEAAKTDAENSAASALISETNASASETAASTSETNAAASAASASTDAGAASTSATNASASETAASASAASASNSEALSAAYSLDSRAEGTRLLGSSANPFFEAGTTGYVAGSTQNIGHSSTSDASRDWQEFSNFQGATQTINNIVSAPVLRSLPIAYDPTRVYKLYFSYWINAGSASSVRTRSVFFTSSGQYTDFDQEVENSPAAGQWYDKVRTIDASGVDADAAQIAAGPAFLNTSSDFDVHIRWCYVQDVTDVEAAANSATAALLSETNAFASETAAATSETNAAASAVTANTAAGAATSAATSASTSETNASASASAASTSETLAASYVLEAVDAVGASVPSTFDSDQNHFSMVGPGASSVTYETVSGKGEVWQLSNSNYVRVVSRNGTPLVANHTYIIEAELRVLSGASPEDEGVVIENRVGDDLRLAVGSVGSNIGGTTLVGSNQLPSDDTWTTISWTYTCPSTPPAGYIYGAYLAYAGNVTSDRTVQGFRLSVKDITSEDAAATSAAAAVVSESNAAASAIGASTSESNAATSAATASTEAGNASSSATAASASQTAASDSASSAASSASLAATYASDAENAETEATAQAAIATSQAATATSEAAAAASSSVLAASYSRGSGLTPNSHFKDGITLWYGGFLISQNAQFAGTVLTDYQGAPYVMQVSTGSRTDMHGEASEIDPDRIYRVRARFYTTGDNTQMYIGHTYSDGQNGTQAQKYSATSGSTYNTGWHEVVGSPITGNTASVNSFATNSREAAPFTLCNFNDSGNTVVFDYLYLEDITDSEAIEDVSASVTINSSAIASIEGAAAYYETVVAAEGSTPAKVRLTAGESGSAVSLIAESITIENPVDGALVEVARFEEGKARLNNAVIRGLSVFPRSDSEIAMPVLLEPLLFLATDGDNVQYQGGDTFGAAPSRIVPDLSGLPTPAAGNSYDVRAINITATDFDVCAKEITAPTNTTRSAGAGTNVGGTPKFRSNKPTSEDAYNDQYQFFFAGTIPRTFVEFEPDGGGGYQYWAEYSGLFDVYVSDSSNSNTLTKVATVSVSASNSGNAASTASIPTSASFSTSRIITTSVAIGQHGSYEFGMHPVGSSTLTSMSNVQYTTQTSSGTTALTDLIPWAVYQPAAD